MRTMAACDGSRALGTGRARTGLMALIGAIAITLMNGCAVLTPAPPPALDVLLDDAAFGDPPPQLDAQALFAPSPAMRAFVADALASRGSLRGGPREALAQVLKAGTLQVEYDAGMTRNAAEAFAARAGNCLSLVIMTAALAKTVELPVQYQSVRHAQSWSRDDSLVYTSGHVNLVVGRRPLDRPNGYDGAASLVIDFLPQERTLGMSSTTIDEATIVAMYANNRAVEMLAAGRLPEAYAWARDALRTQPRFEAAYNTLAVIYLKHGGAAQGAAAERALRAALALAPAYREALANLVPALRARADAEAANATAHATTSVAALRAEADRLAARLTRLEPYPPFHFYRLGIAALQRGDFAAAKTMLQQELARLDEQPAVRHALAQAWFGLGDATAARRELELARASAATPAERARFGAKLAWLRHNGMPVRDDP